MFFGLQETRDSLKKAFENLFEKYGKDFDDDDEIDILSLKVIRKSNSKSTEIQKPRKFGYLYQKEGQEISDNDDSEEEVEDDPETSHLEQIFNERSNILVSVSNLKESALDSEIQNNTPAQKKPRKLNKKNAQLSFDLAILGLLERETSNNLKFGLNLKCSEHFGEANRECFDCSLINIIP